MSTEGAKVLCVSVDGKPETAAAWLGDDGAAAATEVLIVTATQEALASLGSGKFTLAIGLCRDGDGATFSHKGVLPAVVSALQPGCKYVHLESGGTGRGDSGSMELTLSGFMPVDVDGDAAGTGGDVIEGYTRTVVSTPAWEVGSSAQVSIRRVKKKQRHSADVEEAKKVWTVSADDPGLLLGGGLDDATAFADEDDLLANDVLEPTPAPSAAAGGCATKRRACKNCSCGRKEMEEAEDRAAAAAMPANPSACGNCYKGDAFRCASCPYLGKPAFQPGNVVKLDLSVADL